MLRAVIVLSLLTPVVRAQVPIGIDEVTRVRSEFEPRAGEQPLLCDVTPVPPSPNFAFRFRAGYTWHVSESQYLGSTGGWSVFTSIHPEGHPQNDMSFVQHVPLAGAIKSSIRGTCIPQKEPNQLNEELFPVCDGGNILEPSLT